MNQSEFPQAVELQTISACNAKCVICPHPEVSQELPKGSMSMDLFRSIINQVQPFWNCRIIPYLNSEPFLDLRIIDRLRYIATKLDRPMIELSSNVSALTDRKVDEMIGIPLRELRLSLFGFTEETHRALMPGLQWTVVKRNLDQLVANATFRSSIQEIGLVMIDHPLVTPLDIKLAKEFCVANSLTFNFWGFLDRAGNVAQYSNQVWRPRISGCEQHRPLERMHISFTGDVILCCQDWRWKNIIGDVKRQTLLEIWNSEMYQHYRKSIYSGKGEQPEICTRCKLSVPLIS